MTSMQSSNSSIVIWGGGGHGRVVIDLLRVLNKWKIVGIVDSVHPAGSVIMGVPVLGDEDVLPSLIEQGVEHLVVAVGDCAARFGLLEKAKQLGFELPTLKHPSSIVAPSASIGDGCVLCAGAVLGVQATLGCGVILNTRASVDHDCNIGDGSHVAPGAILCGHITVGNKTLIGAGAVVRDHINIGRCVTVGAGAVVVKDISNHRIVCGNPAVEMIP